MVAFYNEIDPYAADWLRNLIAGGHIAPGVVDTRSIEDIAPDELLGYTQVHFFAGIGVWSYALRLAGWPDNRPVWTGSCPCQPFSKAGKGAGLNDVRHLWPHFHWLIEQCKPQTVFGEQVASGDGLAWLDVVHADLEGAGYASAALDLCAAGVGAPHIRQRLYWMANRLSRVGKGRGNVWTSGRYEPANGSEAGGMEHTDGHGSQGWLFRGENTPRETLDRQAGRNSTANAALQVNGFWRDADWLYCRDGYLRPVESGTFPLAHGATARMGRLRAYGNAIVAPLAQAFIKAGMTTIEEVSN